MRTTRKTKAQILAAIEEKAVASLDLRDIIEQPLSLEQRLKALEVIGRDDLIETYKNWEPRVAKNKKKGAPLDQRVSIAVTASERLHLDMELKNVKNSKQKITMSQFIRNRALGSVDIEAWRETAVEALGMLDKVAKDQTKLRRRRSELVVLLDDEDDDEQLQLYTAEKNKVESKLAKITAQNRKRTHRLSGRMSMAEAETIKWRAKMLRLSSSDYLRMQIFSLVPNSDADAHMSLEAKRRFYMAIIEVADNGWGTPPQIYECKQCENYLDEIRMLKERLAQYEVFDAD